MEEKLQPVIEARNLDLSYDDYVVLRLVITDKFFLFSLMGGKFIKTFC